MKLFKDEAHKILNSFSDKKLSEYLEVDLQQIWEECDESEGFYEERLLELIESKITN